MIRRSLLIALAGLMAAAVPAFAQQKQPDDLVAAATAALNRVNQMSPEQRKAAVEAAQGQLPALIATASDWWSKLTPEQQADYQKQLKGLIPEPKDAKNKEK